MHESKQRDTLPPIYSDFADDPEFAELLEMFFETLPEKRQTLEEFYRTGQIEQLRCQAHQLKGAGGGYGFGGLSVVAAELEHACAANDVERVCRQLDEVLTYMDRISV